MNDNLKALWQKLENARTVWDFANKAREAATKAEQDANEKLDNARHELAAALSLFFGHEIAVGRRLERLDAHSKPC